MILRILLVFITAAIFISFMHEWTRIGKKIFSVSLFRLCLPLIILSGVMAYFEQTNILILSYIRNKVQNGMQWMAKLLPLHFDVVPLFRISLWVIISLIPILYLAWRVQQRKVLYQMWPAVYRVSMVIWIVFMFIFLPV